MKPEKAFYNEIDYINLLGEIKSNIEKTRYKAQLSANTEMISLYWGIGKNIIAVQKKKGWGASVVEQLSRDLSREYAGMKGFSRTNIFAMRQFYAFFSSDYQKVPQAVGLLPWGHIRVLLGKVKNIHTFMFYASETLQNGWSRNVLILQIEKKLHQRVGAALTNFKRILPLPDSELAQQTIKDPYLFDFVTIGKNLRERDIELQLVEHITKFLLELGKGFAFIGRQYPVTINGKERFLDLLFYHTRLKCYVVIELKVGEFKPEYTGKMNYYLSAVDDLICDKDDNPTIGMILCKNKDKMDVEYALRDMNKPIGVSTYILESIPKDLESSLPTIEQIETQLSILNVDGLEEEKRLEEG